MAEEDESPVNQESLEVLCVILKSSSSIYIIYGGHYLFNNEQKNPNNKFSF